MTHGAPEVKTHGGPPPGHPAAGPGPEAEAPKTAKQEGALTIKERTERRQTASMMLAETGASFDLADLSEEEFEKELARMDVRLTRIRRIVDSRLLENVHYGIPEGARGSIKKPFLYQSGAEELRKIYRFTQRVVDVQTTSSDEFVSVDVVVGIYNSFGQLLCTRSGNCNTKEKRFKGRGGGWIFADAREAYHGCLTMAEKRAGVLATREACGASAIFATGDELEAALEEIDEGPKTPCTPDERRQFFKDAKAVGITNGDACAAFVKDVLGRDEFYAEDLPKLRERLLARKAGRTTPLAGRGNADPYAEAGKKPDGAKEEQVSFDDEESGA